MTTASRVFIPEGTQPKEGSLAHSSQRLWLKTSTLPLVTEKGSGRHLVISIIGKLLSLSERNLIPVICVWELKGYQSKPNWFGKVRYLVTNKQVGYFSKTRHTKHIYRLFSFLLDLITDLVDSWNAVGSKPSNYNQKHSLLNAKAATLRLAVRLLYLGDSRWVVGGGRTRAPAGASGGLLAGGGPWETCAQWGNCVSATHWIQRRGGFSAGPVVEASLSNGCKFNPWLGS